MIGPRRTDHAGTTPTGFESAPAVTLSEWLLSSGALYAVNDRKGRYSSVQII